MSWLEPQAALRLFFIRSGPKDPTRCPVPRIAAFEEPGENQFSEGDLAELAATLDGFVALCKDPQGLSRDALIHLIRLNAKMTQDPEMRAKLGQLQQRYGRAGIG